MRASRPAHCLPRSAPLHSRVIMNPRRNKKYASIRRCAKREGCFKKGKTKFRDFETSTKAPLWTCRGVDSYRQMLLRIIKINKSGMTKHFFTIWITRNIYSFVFYYFVQQFFFLHSVHFFVIYQQKLRKVMHDLLT